MYCTRFLLLVVGRDALQEEDFEGWILLEEAIDFSGSFFKSGLRIKLTV